MGAKGVFRGGDGRGAMLTPIERVGYLTGVLLLASGFVHLAILLTTGGSWNGPLSWRKPTTFGLSFGLTLITIVWVTSFVRLRGRTRAVALSVFTAASVLETILISMQTWRGVPSHFNVETQFDAWVTRGLAGGGVALVVVIVALTVVAFRSPINPPAMMVAIRTGFAILCGAMATGMIMIARGMMLAFEGHASAAYATGGMLKPTHGVTMHAILILPALAWLLSRNQLSEDRQRRYVETASAGYVLLAAIVAAANIAVSSW
jgi:hypothetical protein